MDTNFKTQRPSPAPWRAVVATGSFVVTPLPYTPGPGEWSAESIAIQFLNNEAVITKV